MASIRPLLILLGLCNTGNALVRGFKENKPVVPNKDPNLLVEPVWEFLFEERATMMKFFPGGKQVMTTHKTGEIRFYPSIDTPAEDYVMMLDMSPDVFSGGDHGLQSFEFHPDFAKGVTKAFVMYTGEPKNVALLPNNNAVSNARPKGWGKGPPGTTGYSWFDICPCLDCQGGGRNENGLICEHPYYIDRIAINPKTGKAVKEVTLLTAACGSSTSHGPGHILNIAGDLYFGVGDGSQYTVMDVGFQNDGCYDTSKGIGQGSLRAIRDDFTNGKIRKIPKALIDSNVELTNQQAPTLIKGARHPWRMHYHEASDILYVADVGFGDAGTSERIFAATDLLAQANNYPVKDFGWPCVEGVRNVLLGDLTIRDGPFEKQFLEWVTNNNSNYCAATYAAAQAYVTKKPLENTNWQPPIFEYRVGDMDDNFPDECTEQYASITSVYFYQGVNMPALYQDKLIFSDYSKQCVWYFDNTKDGLPNTQVKPHVLLSQTGFIDMTTGPDGSLYGVDYVNGRVIRMSTIGNTVDPAELVTPAPTAAATANIEAEPAESCFDSKNMPLLPWTSRPDGAYEGTLVLGAAILETAEGPIRTFAYNGMIPGPTMRMKACSIYYLNLINDLEGWGSAEGLLNTLHGSTSTNLHLHGLHISGLTPGDDVFATVPPGSQYTFTYRIPCDHSGGTNWYHPHFHGSSALQINGGAAGLLIIESSARESSAIPLPIQKMPEQSLFIQDFSPADLSAFAAISKDQVFKTEVTVPVPMINGCENLDMAVEAGQWTKLRMLNSGITFNSMVTILPKTKKMQQCTIGLLAKDGVWLAEVPRLIPTNTLFFSLASRNDIAIRCPTAGDVHQIMYSHIADPFWTDPVLLGTITVGPSFRLLAADLPLWEPCRPPYLMDLSGLNAKALDGGNWALEVRDSLNGQIFSDLQTYLQVMTVEETQQWSVSGTNLHPLHVHVNHMQLGPLTGPKNQWPEVPGWHVAGDWVDTLSLQGNVLVRIRPADFIGPMVLHCHISSHADAGIVGIINLIGNGIDAYQLEYLNDFGTCSAQIPASTPFGGVPNPVPGVIEAENFDEGGEGVGYHNFNYDTLTGPAARFDEAVEIVQIKKIIAVSLIRNYEWLKYTMDVDETAAYVVTLNLSSFAPLEGMKLSLWFDRQECPPVYENNNLLTRVNAPGFKGTGSYEKFANVDLPEAIFLQAGVHILLVCFETDASMLLNSLTLTKCGPSKEQCPARVSNPLLNL